MMPFEIFIMIFGLPILSLLCVIINFILFLCTPKDSEKRKGKRNALIVSAIVFGVILSVLIAFILMFIAALANM